MGRDVVGEDEDRRGAVADDVAGHAVEEIRVHPVEVVEVPLERGLVDLGVLGEKLRGPALHAVPPHNVVVLREVAHGLAEHR